MTRDNCLVHKKYTVAVSASAVPAVYHLGSEVVDLKSTNGTVICPRNCVLCRNVKTKALL
jgi:hypothetical protein